MRYCLRYYIDSKYQNQCEELAITYNSHDTTLPDFLEAHKHQIIIIDLPAETAQTDINLLSTLAKKYYNFKLRFDFNNTQVLEMVKSTDLRFFFANFAGDWDLLNGFLSYKPTDVYISGDLGFCVRDVAKKVHESGVQVRVLPNICQSSFPYGETLTQFYIRPEDTELYDGLIDVFEIAADSRNSMDVFYKVYTIDKKWFGPLKECILGLQNDIDSRYVMPEFGNSRLTCNKVCAKRGHCRMCFVISNVSQKMAKEKN